MNFWKFNETLTNDVVSFEQLGPDLFDFEGSVIWRTVVLKKSEQF